MKFNKFSRRHFLQGASTTALGLPLLPSLLSGRALAQEVNNRQKNFIGITSQSGGIIKWNGPDSVLMPQSTTGVHNEAHYQPSRYCRLSEYASDNGTELNAILPKMSPLNPQYLTKKQSVFQKIAAFVEKFKGIGGKI